MFVSYSYVLLLLCFIICLTGGNPDLVGFSTYAYMASIYGNKPFSIIIYHLYFYLYIIIYIYIYIHMPYIIIWLKPFCAPVCIIIRYIYIYKSGLAGFAGDLRPPGPASAVRTNI